MIKRTSKRRKKIISVRSKFGRKETHELLIHKTGRNIYAYVNDLKNGGTVFSVSTLTLRKSKSAEKENGKPSFLVGKMIGDVCKKKQISPAVNVADNPFCGHVAELVNGFREIIES